MNWYTRFAEIRYSSPKRARSPTEMTLSDHSANGIPLQTERLMAIFNQGDVVKIPFPYTDRSTRQARPALVVSTPGLQEAHNLLWVVMITSAENRGWPRDVAITALSRAGLPAASVIRPAKIATIDAADATKLGTITEAQLRQVLAAIGQALGAAR